LENVLASFGVLATFRPYANSDRLSLLLGWVQAVCTGYEVEVNNFTSSFSDGRVFLYLLHHYCPQIVPRGGIADRTTATIDNRTLETVQASADLGAKGWTGMFSPGNNRVSAPLTTPNCTWAASPE
jgi:abnormal spindle-like microcephaly-associated protein